MSRPCKTERAVGQQRLICDALIGQMEEGSYAACTVSDLCRRAGIPRRTFYYYYDSKEDVLSALMMQILEECDVETMFARQENRQALEQGFIRFFCYWRDLRRRELEAFLRNDLGQRLINGAIAHISGDVQWQSLVLDRPAHRVTIGSMMGMTCVYYTLFYWHRNGYRIDPQELADHVTRLLTEPLYRIP